MIDLHTDIINFTNEEIQRFADAVFKLGDMGIASYELGSEKRIDPIIIDSQMKIDDSTKTIPEKIGVYKARSHHVIPSTTLLGKFFRRPGYRVDIWDPKIVPAVLDTGFTKAKPLSILTYNRGNVERGGISFKQMRAFVSEEDRSLVERAGFAFHHAEELYTIRIKMIETRNTSSQARGILGQETLYCDGCGDEIEGQKIVYDKVNSAVYHNRDCQRSAILDQAMKSGDFVFGETEDISRVRGLNLLKCRKLSQSKRLVQ